MCWTTYNSIRYFLAVSLYPSRDRQTASIILGTASVLSLALIVLSLSLYFLRLRLGWKRRPSSLYTRFRVAANYSSSALLLASASGNVALVCLWRHHRDPELRIEGRCHWDIDVVWSGSTLGCGRSTAIAWGYWVTGAVVRLVITSLILVRGRYLMIVLN